MAVETVITGKDRRVANRMARKEKRAALRAEAEASGLKLPTPRTQAIIAGAVALAAVGITAYVVSSRRKPKLTTIASLWPAAMMLWGTSKSVLKDARQRVEARLH